MNLIKCIKKYWKKVAFSIVVIIVSTVLLNYVRSEVPLLISRVIGLFEENRDPSNDFILKNLDALMDGKSIESCLLILFISILVTTAIRELLNILGDVLICKTSEDVGYRLQVDFFDKVQQMKYSKHNTIETGDLIQRSTSDVDRVKTFMSDTTPNLLSHLLQVVIYSIQMINVNTEMGLILLIFIPFLLIYSFIFHKNMQKIFVQQEEDEGRITSIVQENLTGIRVVKAFNNEQKEIKRLDNGLKQYLSTWDKLMHKMTGFWRNSDTIGYIMMLTAVILGVLFYQDGKASFETISAMILYTQYIMWPTRQLGREFGMLARADIAAKRLAEIIDLESEFDEKNNGQLKPEIDGSFEFEHVSFVFDDVHQELLHDISFKVNKGETVAILGKTGCGKSTLVCLINRLLEISGGDIKFNGVSIKDIDKKHLRRNVGFVLQESFLYSKTLEENIGICLDTFDENKVIEVAKDASIHDDIVRFKDGYKTLVGERGVTLSGGQKQRINIARNLTNNKAILVFDDSLSAVDTETDIKIRKALARNNPNTTKVIITHRVSTAKDADKIIILEKGLISEIGTHEELIARPGLYQDIWRIQGGEEVSK